MEIIYLDAKGNISQRTIFVKRIEGDKVIAFCTLRDEQRIFFLDNILAVQKCAHLLRYVPRPDQSNWDYHF